MYAGTAAAAAAGASGAGGMWLFSYNKENFGYDAGMRFGRFMMSRGFANAQVGQYREDIQGITGMTVTKMDAWQSVTTLFLAVGAALSCAGRVGMHGSAPPGWYCALFSGCIFMSVMFNGIALWLSMHASLRAQCAAVSLLTRKVRLPIPSMSQLDQARVFASAFEKQDYRDIFRVPFMRHAQDGPQVPSAEAEEPKSKGKKGGKAAPEHFGSTARDTVPSWIRDEVVVDKAGGVLDGNGELHAAHEMPDHFQLLMKAQEEWRDYDVYARISMLYGVVSFLYAVTYYAVGYAICELRGFWAMWSLPVVFATAQALIFRLDILRTGNQRLPNAELLGHMAPFFAVAACTLEYRYYFSKAQVAVTWGLVFVAYFCHLLMALRMLDLAWPVPSVKELPEEPGKQWWPSSWQVPGGFAKNLWFITPPKKLEDGQNCLLHEMDNMKAVGGGISAASCRRRKAPAAEAPAAMTDAPADNASPFASMEMKRSNDLPWRIVRVAILTAAFQWFFMMVVSGVEIILGPETLLKPPGEPPWIRDTKYRSFVPGMIHMSNSEALPEKYRLFSASTARYLDGAAAAAAAGHAGGHAGHGAPAATAPAADAAGHATEDNDAAAPGHIAEDHAAPAAEHGSGHRRLATGAEAALQELLDAVPMLSELAAKAAAGAPPTGASSLAGPAELPGSFMAPGPKVREVEWPPLFEPKHLLCAPRAAGAPLAAALTRRGFGALVPSGGARAAPFALEGLEESAPLAGASWTERGLLLVTASGEVLRCDGHAPGDGATWRCAGAQDFVKLPVPKNAELLAVAISEHPEGATVALTYRHLPTVVGLFRADAGAWHPAGELHAPRSAESGLHLAFGGGELLVTVGSGEVLRRRLSAGGLGESVPGLAAAQGSGHEFRAACATPEGELLRLALRRSQGDNAWRPELLAA